MKVLLSAFACEPGRGSEPRVGWQWATQAARFHDVWVLTDGHCRAAIEAHTRSAPVQNLRFVYHSLPQWLWLPWLGVVGEYIYGLLWQLTAIPLCRRLHRQIGFEIAHHVTIVSYQYPSCLAWTSCPFIWGPVGGSLRAPITFYPGFGARGVISELLRDVFNFAVVRSPLLLWTMWRARRIVPTTDFSKNVLPAWTHAKTTVIRAEGGDVGMPPDRSSRRTRDLRILYVGRLVHWKGVHLAIRAFAEYLKSDPGAQFTIHMNGPDRPRLEKLVRRMRLVNNVSFDITSTIAEVEAMYDRHDVFMFPSLHDSGSFVTLEAMARALPVICFDRGGPAHSVTDETGIRIHARTPRQAIADTTAALRQLAEDPELRRRMGEAGRRRIAEAFAWDLKGELLRSLYQEVASEAAADLKQPSNGTRETLSSAMRLRTSRVTQWTGRAIWAVTDQGLFSASNFLANVLLARWLAPREYGAFFTAFVVILLVHVAHSALFIEPMLVFGAGKYADRWSAYFKVLLRYELMFNVVCAVILGAVGAALSLAGYGLLGWSLVGAACAMPAILASWFVRRACYVIDRPQLAAASAAVYVVLTATGLMALNAAGILSSFAAQLLLGAGAVVATVAILAGVLRSKGTPVSIDASAVWTEHWRFGRWSTASGLLSWAQSYLFYLVLPVWGGLEAAGLLRAVTNFVTPVLQSDSALMNLMAPALARARAYPPAFVRTIRWAQRAFLTEGLLYWIVLATFRHPLVSFLYGTPYTAHADLLIVVGAIPVIGSRLNIYTVAARALEHPRIFFRATAAAVLISVVVGFPLLALGGITGAVWAIVLGTATQLVLMAIYMRPLSAQMRGSGTPPVAQRAAPLSLGESPAGLS
jgi:glycosyltransferase involved in cell wall biosynthesis/O-antigen/teichoic acid export membrane protein